jgi:hypothetical protein
LSVSFYMDVHVRRAVTAALRMRSIDVLTAQEDGAAELDDDPLLQRATDLGRVLVSGRVAGKDRVLANRMRSGGVAVRISPCGSLRSARSW